MKYNNKTHYSAETIQHLHIYFRYGHALTYLCNVCKRLINTPYWCVVAFGLAISGCETITSKPAPDASIVATTTKKPRAPVIINDKNFTQESLYALLVAEMAIDRQAFSVALENYTQQAQATQDIEVTARAARIAFSLNDYPQAQALIEQWQHLAPYDLEAKHMLTQTLVQLNKVEEAFTYATKLLSYGEKVDFESIATRVSPSQKALISNLITQYSALKDQHPNNVSLMLGLSLLHEQQGEYQKALHHADQVYALNSQNIKAVYQQTRLLQLLKQNEDAITKMAELTTLSPDNTLLRLRYAGMLTRAKKLDDAHEQYAILLSLQPNDPEILLSLAIVEHEKQLYKSAASHFQRLVDRNQHRSTAHYYLARIAQVQGDNRLAITHYQSVGPSQEYLSAIYSASALITQEQSALEALTYVQNARQTAPNEYHDGLHLREANLLIKLKRFNDADASFEAALALSPDNTAVLYSRAMMLIGNNNLIQAEADLKRILTLRPNHAHALNAYGYTLADKTDRIDEAYALVARAYELEPNNPMIIDSMGWVEYKKGNIDKAITLLQKAQTLLDDPEIAAHLSQALWTKGNKDAALKVLNEALLKNPDNPVLQRTRQHLNSSNTP